MSEPSWASEYVKIGKETVLISRYRICNRCGMPYLRSKPCCPSCQCPEFHLPDQGEQEWIESNL